jgi:hypothetical protein
MISQQSLRDEPFIIRVQKGLVPGHSIISKFAENPSIASATPADIWDYPTEELYTWSTSAAIDSISSSNGGDTQEMVLQGLDKNWKEVIQTANLNGQTRVALSTPLIRIYRAYNNNSVDLLGNVYVYENTAIAGGIPIDTTKVRAYVSIADQQTLMGVYTVPAGKTGYFLGLTSSLSKNVATATAIFTGAVRPFGKIFRTQVRYAMSNTGNSYVTTFGTAASAFPEKTDFVAKADVSANGVGISATFDLLLVDTVHD